MWETGGNVLADDSGLAVDYIKVNREFILPDIWGKDTLMIKTAISLNASPVQREKNAVPVLSVILPLS